MARAFELASAPYPRILPTLDSQLIYDRTASEQVSYSLYEDKKGVIPGVQAVRAQDPD